MTDIKTTDDGAYVFFDGMTWPVPGARLSDAEHRLRHREATREDVLLAASVVAAYRQLVTDTEAKRRVVVRKVRKGMSEAPCRVERP